MTDIQFNLSNARSQNGLVYILETIPFSHSYLPCNFGLTISSISVEKLISLTQFFSVDGWLHGGSFFPL